MKSFPSVGRIVRYWFPTGGFQFAKITRVWDELTGLVNVQLADGTTFYRIPWEPVNGSAYWTC